MGAHRGTLHVSAVATLAGWCAAALGQAPLFLVPDGMLTRPGATIALRAQAGAIDATAAAAWPEDIAWFFVRAAGAQENRDEIKPAAAGADFVSVTLDRAGAAMIGLDLKPRTINTSVASLRAFLAANAPNTPTASLAGRADDAPVVVRQFVSAKAIVRVGDDRSASATAQSKSGQRSELRLMSDPTAMSPGADLPLRFYVEGDSQGGVTILTWSEAGNVRTAYQADGSGLTHFRVTDTGVWRAAANHVKPPDTPGGAWTVYTATLTFALPTTEAGG